jgi:hypothetical protein
MTVLCLALPGCSLWHSIYDREREVIVTQLALMPECAASDPGEPQLHYFEAAATVRSWQQQHGLAASEIDASIEGPFALVEGGLAGQSLLVSRDAILHSGGRLVLEGTFFHAANAAGSSPCVLLALPPRDYAAIELYDQEGALRARTTEEEEP